MASLPPFPPAGDGGMDTPWRLSAQGISLRRARDDDLPWLRALYATTRAAEMAAMGWPEDVQRAFLDSQFGLQHRHYLQHYGDAEFLVAQRQQTPLGRYYLLRGQPDDLIVDISIDPAAQGQGIASALIAQTQLDAAGRGRGVQLHVLSLNLRAQGLYHRHGFRVLEDAGGYLRMRWASEQHVSSEKP